jgi:hypothetical protein
MSFRTWFSGLDGKTQSYFKYVAYTSGYSMTRKVIEMWDAKLYVKYDKNANKVDKYVPVLMADKLFVTGFATIAGVYLWPMYVWKDLNRIEIAARRLSVDDYETCRHPTHVGEYLF